MDYPNTRSQGFAIASSEEYVIEEDKLLLLGRGSYGTVLSAVNMSTNTQVSRHPTYPISLHKEFITISLRYLFVMMPSTEDEFVDATIANLKIIGMVPKNGKLCVRKGQLCIDSPRVQCVRRWIHGDSRDTTLVHAKNTINSSINIAKSIMSNYEHLHREDNLPVGRCHSLWNLDRIVSEMGGCELGLQNLKRTTYSGDSMMVANLDVIIEREIANKEEIKDFLDKHYHGRHLSSSAEETS